ncbi:MAG: winged helix-turn-helix domain-containing protein [Actinomycetota bacterium]|nr:winged helix-turn-helix domain-containing protein [Actinomycetota bacterium]
MTVQKPRVLVCIQEPALRAVTTAMLRSCELDVAASPSGILDIALARHARPDVVVVEIVVDVEASDLSFTSILELSPVLCLVAPDNLAATLRCFDAGADDCVPTTVSPVELAARLRVLLRRVAPTSTGRRSVECSGLTLDPDGRTVLYLGVPIPCTYTEFEVLAILLRSAGTVVSKTTLMQGVWNYVRTDSNLVEVHMTSLRRKIERVGPRVIHTVRRAGYVVRPMDPIITV